MYAGFLGGNRLRDKLNSGWLKHGLVAMATVLLGVSALIQVRLLNESRPAYVKYAQFWDEADAQILEARERGEDSVTIPVIRSWTGLDVLNDNPRFWVNVCYRKYYDIPVLGPSLD
jgi:hypothetical protein